VILQPGRRDFALGSGNDPLKMSPSCQFDRLISERAERTDNLLKPLRSLS